MKAPKALVARKQVKVEDTWDLSSLFKTDSAWERAFKELEKQIEGYARFQGTLGDGPDVLRQCLDFDSEVDRAAERLMVYAHLKMSEDLSNSAAVGLVGRITSLGSRAMQAASFIRPEILALPARTLDRYMKAEELASYRFHLEKLLRQKPHILSPAEERLLAMQAEPAMAASRIFNQLNNSDLKFGAIEDADGRTVELTHGTYRSFLESEKPSIRRKAFHQYYAAFEAHQNTLAAALSSSAQQDVFYARARGYDSSLGMALFDDNVPRSVYENLVRTVRANLGVVHEYFDLRRRALKLKEIHQYDTYVPILSELRVTHSFDRAAETLLEALKPLGPAYVKVLEKGLESRWVDRYENQGKRSGAFSSGSYDGAPYMLLNFKEDVLDDVFTLAHEAGHSMHSHFSARNQPYHSWSYSIFVAEVASTFNEQLLTHHLSKHVTDEKALAFLVNREIDAIRGTLVRQTMFADFELKIHEILEAGEALTLQRLRQEYRKLLDVYFGPEFAIDDELELECLRIPHFYRAFYVYKYATGISAAIALAERVLQGGKGELTDYLGFLKSGSSKYPLEILEDAGVDMTTPRPIEVAMGRLGRLTAQLKGLLKLKA